MVMSYAADPDVLAGVDADVAVALIAAAADVALFVDGAGVIRNVTIGSEDLKLDGSTRWVGQPWSSTVTVESRPKVAALLADAAAHAARKWRHINHPSAGGADVPILYSAIKVGGDGGMVAFGRDLRALATLQQRLVAAQQAMERDYLRLRHMETRYRLLFDMASEAVLVVNADTMMITEANPAAAEVIGQSAKALVGRSLLESFEESSRPAVSSALAGVRASGRPNEIRARLAGGSWELGVAASLFRQETGSLFLVRLSPVKADGAAHSGDPRSLLLQTLASIPDGFVVTDVAGRILAANMAFVEMTQLAAREQVEGESMERWLGRAGVDLNVLIANLRQHGLVRLFATTLRGQYGSTTDVEISGTAVPHDDQPCYGFTVRDVGRRISVESMGGGRELPRSASQLAGLVGRMPLKDIVGETTDLIEQLCIEAALELTRDNRASAAEMLGLSRQSLYVKLRRYGLGDLGSDNDR
jgi:transcriptional regulator PpsR